MNSKSIPVFLFVCVIVLFLSVGVGKANVSLVRGELGAVETVEGSMVFDSGTFYLTKAYGPGMFHEFEATGNLEVLKEALRVSRAIRDRDAQDMVVGRMNTLRFEVRMIGDGKVEILSFRRL
jgi:hypothetical protein